MTIDAFYYCPHHPDATVAAYRMDCDCRKPKLGMLRRAERELGIDLARSFTVGDRWHDVAMASAVGAQGLLVRTGYGASEEAKPQAGITPAAIVDNLAEAASWILLGERAAREARDAAMGGDGAPRP